jgi:hypothetical protein
MPQALSLVPTREKFIAEPRDHLEPGHERRAHPRQTLFTAGMLLFEDGGSDLCTIVDRSLGGFRLRLNDERELPDRFTLIDLVAGLGFEGQTVWRKPPEAGCRALMRYDLRRSPKGRGARLQEIWKASVA